MLHGCQLRVQALRVLAVDDHGRAKRDGAPACRTSCGSKGFDADVMIMCSRHTQQNTTSQASICLAPL